MTREHTRINRLEEQLNELERQHILITASVSFVLAFAMATWQFLASIGPSGRNLFFSAFCLLVVIILTSLRASNRIAGMMGFFAYASIIALTLHTRQTLDIVAVVWLLTFPVVSTFGFGRSMSRPLLALSFAYVCVVYLLVQLGMLEKANSLGRQMITFDLVSTVAITFLGLFATILFIRFQRKQEELLLSSSDSEALFLAKTSHEMRNPLNVLGGTLDYLLSDGELNRDQRQNFHHAREYCSKLEKILNDVLTLRALQNGSLLLRGEALDLQEIFLKIEKKYAQVCQEKGIQFQACIGAGSFPVRNLLDEHRLVEIVSKALDNAVLYTKSGAVMLWVTCEDALLSIGISDTGIGIAQDQLEEIFLPFNQLDQSSRKRFQGAGLSLSIVQGLVKRHGGSIDLESSLGQGTTVRITLPLTLQSNASEHLARESEKDFGSISVVEESR